MSSAGKKKTTMAKLNREAKLRERRSDKQARKVARRDAAETAADEPEVLESEVAESEETTSASE